MNSVIIYTDGGCEGNPGPGGWGAVVRCGDAVREISGGELATTNNRMEMRAAIESLATLTERSEVCIFTDSQYLKNGITQWINGWKRRGWVTSTKAPVKNVDLWKRLDQLVAHHRVTWKWVKGHAGNADNERCDGLAGREIAKLKRQHPKADRQAALQVFKNPEPAKPVGAERDDHRAGPDGPANPGGHHPSPPGGAAPSKPAPRATMMLHQPSLF